MKNILRILSILLAAVFFITACQDDNQELGRMLDKSEITFEVVQDLTKDPGGNTVILKNTTPETIAMWDYGTGRSTRTQDTIHFAFKGDYVIKFSALTAGGIVDMGSKTVTVTSANMNYVNGPLWTAISGGVDKEKTWVLDLNHQYFDGPLYFYGTNNGWEGTCLITGGDCWNWNPEYASNTWLMDGGDYGTMTFSMKGGPFAKANHLKIPALGAQSGTYFIDESAKTLTLTGIEPLHDTGRDGCVDAWGNIKLLSLTENAMQLAVLRTSCEGPCLLVYNYVVKK